MIERSTAVAVLLASLLAVPVRAQDDRYTPLQPLPLGALLLSMPSNHVPAPGTWHLRFNHRFNGSADEGSLTDRFRTLFGMDSGANVTMAIAYAPARDVELSLARSNSMDDYELAARYVVVQQAKAIPLSVAVRGGADWRTESGIEDRSSIFAQAILSRRMGARAEVFVIPTVVTNAGRSASGDASRAQFSHAFNAPIGVALLVWRNTTAVAEWTPPNRDLPHEMRSDGAWALGVKKAIGGHHFEVMLTNSQATTVDQYTTTTYVGAPLRTGDVHIGFNIERQFGGSR